MARLLRTRGLRGEFYAVAYNTDPARFLQIGPLRLFARSGMGVGGGAPVEVEQARLLNRRLVLKFRGIDSIEEAEQWEGGYLCLLEEARPPLDEGEFYVSDLIGCQVVDSRTGTQWGVVKDVFGKPGSSVLVVEPEEKNAQELLIPFHRAICPRIDPGARRIEVDPPEGLLELNRE